MIANQIRRRNTSPTTLESLKFYTAHGRLCAVFELTSLDKQRTLRASVERLTHGTMLPLNRLSSCSQAHHPWCLNDGTAQPFACAQRAKYKHVEQLTVICNHGKEFLAANTHSGEGHAIKPGSNYFLGPLDSCMLGHLSFVVLWRVSWSCVHTPPLGQTPLLVTAPAAAAICFTLAVSQTSPLRGCFPPT
jgi:hypothetical protein